jgi:hypothetical protein
MSHTKTIAPTGTEAGFDLDKLEALRLGLCKINRRHDVEHLIRQTDELIALARRAALAPADSVLNGHWEPMGKFARRFVPDAPDTTDSASGDCSTCGGSESISDPMGWQFERVPCPDCAAQPVQAGEAVDERALFEAAYIARKQANDPSRTLSDDDADTWLARSSRDESRYLHAQEAWEGWQARASLAPVSAQQGAAKAATTVEKDGCRLCLGAKGGVPGNENVIGGVVVCDYCSSTLMDMKSAGWFGADKAPAEGSPQDNCTDCGGSRAHKGDKARDCESCDGTGRGWAQRENAVKAPASGYVHLAGEDVLGGAKRIAENVRHWAPAAQGCPSCGRAPGERRDECEQCPEAPAAQAVDLSKLPLHFKEGIENGGYYLATDVIRALALAASPASTPEAAPEQQLATAEALADEELDAIFMPLMPSLPAPYALRIYGREVEAEVARRFRAQGGNTNDSSANLAAPTAGAATTSEDARDANSNLIAKMREMLDIQGQSGTWNCNPYMHGMYNGMAYMLAMVDGTEPCFRRAPVKWLDKPAEMSTAAKDVLNERSRQVKSEGWSLSHDDAHEGGELALAAACYAAHHIYPNILNIWSWSPEWWKPAEPRRNLVKAGALILADIERIDRAAMRATQQEGE